MSKIKFEEICTGGGCCGFFASFKKYTFYLTTKFELTLPKKGEDVSIGIYNADFEDQYAMDVIKNFDPKKMEEYVRNTLDKYSVIKRQNKELFVKRKDYSNDIIYLDEFDFSKKSKK